MTAAHSPTNAQLEALGAVLYQVNTRLAGQEPRSWSAIDPEEAHGWVVEARTVWPDVANLLAFTPEPLEAVAARHVRGMLEHTHGHRRKAAELLGLSRSTLLAKIRRFGLQQIGGAAMLILTSLSLATSCASEPPVAALPSGWIWEPPYVTSNGPGPGIQIHTHALVPGDSSHSVSVVLVGDSIFTFEDEEQVPNRYPEAEHLLRATAQGRPLR